MDFINRSLVDDALEFYPYPGLYKQVSGLSRASQLNVNKGLTNASGSA
jgi:hypothetical protein